MSILIEKELPDGNIKKVWLSKPTDFRIGARCNYYPVMTKDGPGEEKKECTIESGIGVVSGQDIVQISASKGVVSIDHLEIIDFPVSAMLQLEVGTISAWPATKTLGSQINRGDQVIMINGQLFHQARSGGPAGKICNIDSCGPWHRVTIN